MIRHTLNEFMKQYNPSNIQLIFGNHIVNIQTDVKGSAALVKYFGEAKFDFDLYDKGTSYLRLYY